MRDMRFFKVWFDRPNIIFVKSHDVSEDSGFVFIETLMRDHEIPDVVIKHLRKLFGPISRSEVILKNGKIKIKIELL